MIACVSPAYSSANHTINTLRYSDRLKEKTKSGGEDSNNNLIQVNPNQNVNNNNQNNVKNNVNNNAGNNNGMNYNAALKKKDAVNINNMNLDKYMKEMREDNTTNFTSLEMEVYYLIDSKLNY